VKGLAAGLFALLLAACAAPAPKPAEPWLSKVESDHPLVGRIWSVADRAFLTEDELVARLAASRYVMLGEKHDNPDHHRLQARLVRAMTDAGRRPAIVFEMIDEGQAPALENWLARGPADAAGLGPAIGWENSGWPDWSVYQPIADAAVAAKLRIRAGNLSREGIRAVARDGWTALAPERVSRLALKTEPSEETRAAMTEEMRVSQCGMLPDESIAPMIRVQRVRDGLMAEAMARPGADGAVLIAGDGHVRRDRGAPWFLALLDKAPTATVAFLEVDKEKPAVADYGRGFDGHLPFDYVWFTPRVDDRDPCERFRHQLKGLGGMSSG
jgi:uncharacterized iron-regulated protein